MEMRQRGDGYGTIASAMGMTTSMVRRIIQQQQGAVLKILLGVGLGFLLFTNQDARPQLLTYSGRLVMPLLLPMRTGRSKTESTRCW